MARELRAAGSSTQINTSTLGIQSSLTLTPTDRGFMAAWWDQNGGAGVQTVRAQFFDFNGNAVGTEFDVVDTGVLNNGARPAIAASGDGSAVLVTYFADLIATGTDGFYGRFIDGPASFTDSSFEIDQEALAVSTGTQPSVSFSPDANIYGAAFETGNSITFQRVQGDGTLLGPAIALGDGDGPMDSDTLKNGSFIVVWREGTTTASEIRMNIVDPNGNVAFGAPVRIDATSGVVDSTPTVTALSNGNFVVTWYDSTNDVIFYRLFDSTGTALTGQLRADTDPVSIFTAYPGAVALADGWFAVYWRDGNGSVNDIRVFDEAGIPQGQPFDLNLGFYVYTDAFSFGNGTFVVAGATNTSLEPTFQIMQEWNVETGTTGADVYIGMSIRNDLSGGDDSDTLFGGTRADILNGDGGADVIIGGNGADIINGGADSDYIDGGAGADDIDGGDGTDALSFLTANAGVTVYLFETANQVRNDGFGNVETLESIEYLVGSNHADVLIGDGKDNVLQGMQGDDVFFAGFGNDFISGGAGNDFMQGDEGYDWFAFDVADFTSGVFDIISDFSESATSYDVLYINGLTLADLTIVDLGSDVYVFTTAGFDTGLLVQNFSAAQLADQLLFT